MQENYRTNFHGKIVRSILFSSNRHDSHRPSQAWKVRGEYPNAIVYPNGKILLIPDTHLEAVCHEADLRYVVFS